ncbi:Predicted dehydrogenase [Friedmanniella luteola]|uniref:Predicted dehydrogenase n=1 Tax=Friedmanniella luteola TaxID=546871 RepID=A0A1H1LI57_9ACTN|nr:Predicted dehydrogenase [Friedmanniella luteola]
MVRIGLVGYGFGGRYFHAPLIASAPGCALAGVVTRSPDRRAELAHDHPEVAVFDTVDDLVAAGVSAVTVCTPAATHTAVTEGLLRRGLPVVCDKPFALDAQAARQTVELAEREGVLVTPYQNRRWDSDLLTIRRLLEAGRLGEVRRFESAFERWAPEPEPPAAGGGLLRDFGSHLVDQALHLFGPVRRVYAETHAVGPESEDDVLVLLQHTSGVRSQVSGAWRQSAPRPRFRLSGRDATFVVTSMDGQEAALVAGRTPAGEGAAWGREPQTAWGTLHRSTGSEAVPSERGRWDQFYEQFAAAVRGTAAVPVDPWDAVATATVLDAARRSAAEGTTVDVPPTSH